MSNVGKYALVRSGLNTEVFLPYLLKVVRETPNTITLLREGHPCAHEKQVKVKDVLGFVQTMDALDELNKKNQEIKDAMLAALGMQQALLDEIAENRSG